MLSQTIINKLKEDHEYCHLVLFDFNGIQVAFTESSYDITYNGINYLSNGILLSIGNIKESSDLKVNSVGINLSSVDKSIIAILLQNDQIGRQVTIRRAYIERDTGNIFHAEVLTYGEITAFGNNSSKDSSVLNLSISGAFADWQRVSGRVTTVASQARHYPNDKGMEFANQVRDDLVWGGK